MVFNMFLFPTIFPSFQHAIYNRCFQIWSWSVLRLSEVLSCQNPALYGNSVPWHPYSLHPLWRPVCSMLPAARWALALGHHKRQPVRTPSHGPSACSYHPRSTFTLKKELLQWHLAAETSFTRICSLHHVMANLLQGSIIPCEKNQTTTRWWFQPGCEICSSSWIISHHFPRDRDKHSKKTLETTT